MSGCVSLWLTVCCCFFNKARTGNFGNPREDCGGIGNYIWEQKWGRFWGDTLVMFIILKNCDIATILQGRRQNDLTRLRLAECILNWEMKAGENQYRHSWSDYLWAIAAYNINLLKLLCFKILSTTKLSCFWLPRRFPQCKPCRIRLADLAHKYCVSNYLQEHIIVSCKRLTK